MKNEPEVLNKFYKYINGLDSLYNLSESEFEEYNDRVMEFLAASVFNRTSSYENANSLAFKLSNLGDSYTAYLFLKAESKTRKKRYEKIFYKARAVANLLFTGIHQKAEIILLELLNEVGNSPIDIGLQCYILVMLGQINAIFKEDYITAENYLIKVQELYKKAPEENPPGTDSINRENLFNMYYNSLFEIYNRALGKITGTERKHYIEKIGSLNALPKSEDQYFKVLYELNKIENMIAMENFDSALDKLKCFDKQTENDAFERWVRPSIFRDYAKIYSKLGKIKLMYKYARMSIMSCKIYGNSLDENILINDIIDMIFEHGKKTLTWQTNIEKNPFIEQLMQLLRLKDWYTSADHSANVRNIASNISEYMIKRRKIKIDKKTLDELRYGAYLHDIGKLYIPWFELNKITPLTREEFTLIKNHTVFGKQILDRLGMTMVSNYALDHHERVNRKGYPYRIKPNILTNIVAASDYFDAATSESRKYKAPKTYNQACNELMKDIGKGFYPEIINSLCSIVESGKDPKANTLEK
ncbi:MAG: HD domain-containing protein [Proteobacteria bacterium]|nr:HD domain-containing protein [Pseudomonadota bacterium]